MPSSLPTQFNGPTPKLGRIRVYPFKSLPGLELCSSQFNLKGGLKNDRRYAFALPDGRFFNAKSDPRIHRIQLRTSADMSRFDFSLANTDDVLEWRPDKGSRLLESWIKKHFNIEVVVRESEQQGFPDDLAAPGPTVISTETIQTIASWYPGISEENMRKRLRTNLEIVDVPAFWEDQLFGEKDSLSLRFSIGSTEFQGSNPCQRCIVPSRDPISGEATQGFSQVFRANRQSTLPPWAPRTQFNHFFRAATNTTALIKASSERISVGQPVKIGDSLPFR